MSQYSITLPSDASNLLAETRKALSQLVDQLNGATKAVKGLDREGKRPKNLKGGDFSSRIQKTETETKMHLGVADDKGLLTEVEVAVRAYLDAQIATLTESITDLEDDLSNLNFTDLSGTISDAQHGPFMTGGTPQAAIADADVITPTAADCASRINLILAALRANSYIAT